MSWLKEHYRKPTPWICLCCNQRFLDEVPKEHLSACVERLIRQNNEKQKLKVEKAVDDAWERNR